MREMLLPGGQCRRQEMHLGERSDKRVLKVPFYSVLTVSQILTRGGIYVVHFSRPFSNGLLLSTDGRQGKRRKNIPERFAHFSLSFHTRVHSNGLYTHAKLAYPPS